MPRVRVKIPKEPKIIEMPAHLLPAQQEAQLMTKEADPAAPAVIAPAESTPTPVPAPPVVVRTPEVTPESVPDRPVSGPQFTLRRRSTNVFAIGIAVCALFIIFAIGIFGGKPSDEQTLGASTAAQTEDERYYNEVKKIVELPDGQTPRVVNISDAEAIKKDSVALSDVKNGDKMLFFTKSRKVVVYRPDTKKVVAVVSLAANDSAPQSN